MTHELKFRYVYGIPGKPETYFFRFFTIEEIEKSWSLEVDQGDDAKYDGCKIISRDQFIGKKDKNGIDIYENDKLSTPTISNLVVIFKDSCFRATDIYRLDQFFENDLEIIGNIYGISTKNDNPNPNEDT